MRLNHNIPVFIIASLLMFLSLNVKSQVDNTLWFVAPEVTNDHGDAEVVLRITAFDQDAEVTISMHSDPGFNPRTINVAANSQETFQFAGPDVVENRPADQVNNKGVLITSDVDISAYYEVTHGNNPDKFTLKGDNALGTNFLSNPKIRFRTILTVFRQENMSTLLPQKTEPK
ncbi:MAG: hypothetical protein R6U46_02505 [Marinilabilia sp.]